MFIDDSAATEGEYKFPTRRRHLQPQILRISVDMIHAASLRPASSPNMRNSPGTPTPSSPARRRSHRKNQENYSAFPTPPEDAFGTPTLTHSLRTKGRMSPAPNKLLEMVRASSTPPDIGFPKNRPNLPSHESSAGLSSATNLEQIWKRRELSKKKSQYYDEAFAYREPNHSAKDRVLRDSVVTAAVKLNCHVWDILPLSKHSSLIDCQLEKEQEFLLDLSFQLSEIYQRPESSIMVMVLPEIPMLLGGCSEAAYHLTITALPSEVAPNKNKRSTRLLQKFMQDTLNIDRSRGIMRFEAVLEENLATNGMTTLQEIEEMESSPEDHQGVLRTISRQTTKIGKKSIMPIFTERGKTPALGDRTPPRVQFNSDETAGSKDSQVSGPERKRIKRRKSIMAFFKK